MGLEKIKKKFDLFRIQTHPIPLNPHGLRANRTGPYCFVDRFQAGIDGFRLDWAWFANTCGLNEQLFGHGLVFDPQLDDTHGSGNDPGCSRLNRTWPYLLNIMGRNSPALFEKKE
jgi:hypothetical protein